ncbi:hypothetical protein LOAG_12535 [Loa loa]|uniref:Uncharacterized protein n=1 Tax=Loa loa TaxID=7209 RepID=A0A1S0TKZ3_LOALO|nr:hypothetical protein LOAG_12535 [Loa loa]EFO15974.1 hypothetical protein LOAG_12535 [Loa loa]
MTIGGIPLFFAQLDRKNVIVEIYPRQIGDEQKLQISKEALGLFYWVIWLPTGYVKCKAQSVVCTDRLLFFAFRKWFIGVVLKDIIMSGRSVTEITQVRRDCNGRMRSIRDWFGRIVANFCTYIFFAISCISLSRIMEIASKWLCFVAFSSTVYRDIQN